MSQPHDVVVIGGGPAGYTAARRAAEHGLRVALIESGDLGGTCLNIGCIPSKALIHAARTFETAGGPADPSLGIRTGSPTIDLAATMRWKDGIVAHLRTGVDGLVSNAGVDVIRGVAEVIDPGTVRVVRGDDTPTLRTDAIVVATGSAPMELPDLPFGDRVLSSTEALSLVEVPGRLVVVGAGYIGLELGTALAKLGAEVTMVEMTDGILPQFDRALVRPVARRLDELGIQVHLSTRAVAAGDEGVIVEGPAGRQALGADLTLVTVGRRARIRGVGLERLGLDDSRGHLDIDEHCRTAVPGVYAIGDVTGEPMLAHRGIAQGELVADVLAGLPRTWDHLAIPAVCFTDPEVFSVGLSPDDARLDGDRSVTIGQAPFRSNGRAVTRAETLGFVRVVADRSTGVVLGVQGVGAEVAELAASAALIVQMMATLADLRATMIAHPTLSEALVDAVSAT